MELNNEFLQQTILGNTVQNLLWFAGILFAGFAFKKVISILITRFAFRFFKKYSKGVRVETFLTLLTKPISVFVMLIILYLAFGRLQFPQEWQVGPEDKFGVRMILSRSFQAALIISFVWILLRVIDYFGQVFLHRAKLTESRMDDMLIPFVKQGIKIIVATFGLLTILGSVFNVNIVTLVGGLGIGGLAAALAAKDSLENLLGSFLIFLDKPFLVGDQVKAGNVEGVVEHIGFRSTQIRAFDRTLISVPNKKMIDAELENQTKREHRRARFTFGLTYNTSLETIDLICKEIEHSLNEHAMIEKETFWVRFVEMSPSSLDIQVNYFVHTAELPKFLEVKEAINFRIIEVVRNNNGRFAYPSTSVYLEQSNINPITQ
jgi:MscS family membrane protein